MSPHDLPELQGRNGELRLMTVRSEGQFNTVVYEEEDSTVVRTAAMSSWSILKTSNGWVSPRMNA